MNDEQANVSMPSSRLYLAVNAPAGLLYAIVLPVAVTLWFGLPVWAVVLVTLVWALLSLRIVDRYIPVLTDPLVRLLWRMYLAWKRSR